MTTLTPERLPPLWRAGSDDRDGGRRRPSPYGGAPRPRHPDDRPPRDDRSRPRRPDGDRDRDRDRDAERYRRDHNGREREREREREGPRERREEGDRTRTGRHGSQSSDGSRESSRRGSWTSLAVTGAETGRGRGPDAPRDRGVPLVEGRDRGGPPLVEGRDRDRDRDWRRNGQGGGWKPALENQTRPPRGRSRSRSRGRAPPYPPPPQPRPVQEGRPTVSTVSTYLGGYPRRPLCLRAHH
jgi:hypothetical protein